MKYIIILSIILSATFSNAADLINGNYKLDKDHAHIGFNVSHLGISLVPGRFNTFDGTATLNLSGESSVNFVIQTNSIDTNSKARDKHLRNEDFFDVETYETITFISTKVEISKNKITKIVGDLTMKDVTESVSFDIKTIGAAEARGKQKAGFQATTTIKRSDFDMGGFKTIGDEVAITVNLEIEKVD